MALDRGKVQAILVAAVVLAWATAPFLAPRATVNLLALSSLYAIAGLGVALLLGYCGIVTLAQSAFYGIGAYSTSYLTVSKGWGVWTGFVVGVVLSGLLAFLIGKPMLKLGGYYLALATLALAIIAFIVFNQADEVTGGSLGVGGIPELFGGALNDPKYFYFFGWALAAFLMFLSHNLVTSRTGLAMRALRDHPAAAESLGVEIPSLRLKLFIFSAILGAFAGSLFAHYVNYIAVDSFTVAKSLTFVLIAVLGGARYVWGAAVGAVFITVAPEILSDFGDLHQVLFGIILVLAIVIVPDGIAGTVGRLFRRPAVGAS